LIEIPYWQRFPQVHLNFKIVALKPILMNGQVTVKDMKEENLSMAAEPEVVYEKKKRGVTRLKIIVVKIGKPAAHLINYILLTTCCKTETKTKPIKWVVLKNICDANWGPR
jgi:hypothetical protein